MPIDRVRPIATPHPLIMIVSLFVLGGMLYWGYKTEFREPRLKIVMPVVFLITVTNTVSRNARSKRNRVVDKSGKSVLHL